MANPDPEISPEDVAAIRNDAICATGRSDYANQINNVLGFPYIFRGALDVQASTINEEMKIAAAHAVASLAREDVPDEVAAAYSGRRLQYGPEYIIPAPFDPRLIIAVPKAVAQAAMDSGVARRPIIDMAEYENQLRGRLDPTAAHLQLISDYVRAHPKRIAFAEGEEETVIRAAVAYRNSGYGTPILIGREDRIAESAKSLGIESLEGVEISNAALSHKNKEYAEFLYGRLQRKGFLWRDCQRMVNQKRNVFAAVMVAKGDADGLITGLTRNFHRSFTDISSVIDAKPGEIPMGLSIAIAKGRTVFIADTRVHNMPDAEQLAEIAIQAAEKARQLGHEPRVAMVSHSTFGNPWSADTDRIREAVGILERSNVDFEFDGDIAVDVALDTELLKLYPFCRLSGPANVLVMPALHAATTASKLLDKLGGGTVVGPVMIGLEKPAQITQMGSTVNDLVNLAALAAHEAEHG
jgi:malate dehydrogenase (oxaloacetate-decarboxylating)(NADP+)